MYLGSPYSVLWSLLEEDTCFSGEFLVLSGVRSRYLSSLTEPLLRLSTMSSLLERPSPILGDYRSARLGNESLEFQTIAVGGYSVGKSIELTGSVSKFSLMALSIEVDWERL